MRRFVPAIDTMESRFLLGALATHAIPGPGTGAVVGAVAGGATYAPSQKLLFPSYPAHQTPTFPWAIKP